MPFQKALTPDKYVPQLIFITIIILWLTVVGYTQFLLFHGIVELICIIFASCIFTFAWNTRQNMENNYLFNIGIAYFFVALFEALYTLNYKGMNLFPRLSVNIPVQLWIAARYLESIALFIAPVFLRRKIEPLYLVIGYMVATLLLITSIFVWQIFPTCFIEGKGYTSFKLSSEILICLILVAGIIHLYFRRRDFDRDVADFMVLAMLMLIAAQVMFAFNSTPYHVPNMIAYYFKIIAFYLVYKAIVETGLTKPYAMLFRNLKQSEENFKAANIQLQKEQMFKDQFLRLTVHDLRSPLTILMGYLSIMKGTEDQQIKQKMESTSKNMLSLVNDLLDYQAISRGNIKLNLSNIDTTKYFNDLYSAYLLLAREKNIQLFLELDPDLPNLVIDTIRINQVISNLISNAFKYSMAETKVVLKVEKQNHAIQVSVIDQGVGIPTAEFPKLFTEFGTTSVAPTGEEKSVGLGLAISKWLVEAHGGTIGVESEPGKGSVFRVTLPIMNPDTVT
ncbi:MAG: MASE3 domain-containing protein [bacterium]